MRHLALACCSLLAAAALAATALENIPLKWTPTSTLSEMGSLDISGAMLSTKIHIDSFVDARQNPSLVGENREKADKVRQVTTSGDVPAFIAEHLKQSLHDAGLTVVDGAGQVTLSAEVRQFFVNEVNTYGGEISLVVHLKDSAGKELWSGVISGDATRWGRSYSAANYYETMSDMTLRASYNLLANAGFHAALAGH